jgi:hypothetical protein
MAWVGGWQRALVYDGPVGASGNFPALAQCSAPGK